MSFCCNHFLSSKPRTTDAKWRRKSKISEKLGWCGHFKTLKVNIEKKTISTKPLALVKIFNTKIRWPKPKPKIKEIWLWLGSVIHCCKPYSGIRELYQPNILVLLCFKRKKCWSYLPAASIAVNVKITNKTVLMRTKNTIGLFTWSQQWYSPP